MHALIWRAAKADELLYAKAPCDERVTVHAARLHADFNRMLSGQPLKFPETNAAVARIREELNELGFEPSFEERDVRDDGLGVVGKLDAHGSIQGVPVILEVKCVRFLPQVIRAAEAAQLMMYAMGRYGERADEALLLGVYVQPCPPFRVGIRPVLNFSELEPYVRQLAA